MIGRDLPNRGGVVPLAIDEREWSLTIPTSDIPKDDHFMAAAYCGGDICAPSKREWGCRIVQWSGTDWKKCPL